MMRCRRVALLALQYDERRPIVPSRDLAGVDRRELLARDADLGHRNVRALHDRLYAWLAATPAIRWRIC